MRVWSRSWIHDMGILLAWEKEGCMDNLYGGSSNILTGYGCFDISDFAAMG